MDTRPLVDCDDQLCKTVLGAAVAVHRELGPGLLESVYEKAMIIELADKGISAHSQVEVSASYRGHNLGLALRADIIVENKLLLELKCVKEFNDLHMAQIITYLKLLRFKRGYLLNFNSSLMKHGIKRVSI